MRTYKGMDKKLAMRLWVREMGIRTLGFARSHGVNFSHNGKKLASYKNIHKGERCFLIGNGPSLTAKDLDLLKDEYSIGCNLINKIFDETSWRPTYHCVIDGVLASDYGDEICNAMQDIPIFTNVSAYQLFPHAPENAVVLYNISKPKYYVHDNLLSYYIPSGTTVMSLMMELAVYMGFSQIYLLGVDCTSTFQKQGNFTSNYVEPDIKKKDIESIHQRMKLWDAKEKDYEQYFLNGTRNAFEVLDAYTRKKGVEVINVTRGGELNVFQRDSLEHIVSTK